MKTGSETFGTEVIKTDEYVMLAEVIVNNGGSVEQASLEIQAIDDLLRIHRMDSISRTQRRTPTGRIRPRTSTRELMEGRIEVLAEELQAIKPEIFQSIQTE